MLAPLAKLWIASRLTKARRREYILSNDLLSYKGRRLHADRVNPQNRTAVWKKREVMRDITSRRVLCEIKVREEKSGRIGIWIVSLVRYSSLRIQSAEHSLFLPPYLFPFFSYFLSPFLLDQSESIQLDPFLIALLVTPSVQQIRQSARATGTRQSRSLCGSYMTDIVD